MSSTPCETASVLLNYALYVKKYMVTTCATVPLASDNHGTSKSPRSLRIANSESRASTTALLLQPHLCISVLILDSRATAHTPVVSSS